MTKQMISTATDRVNSLSQSIKQGLLKGKEYVNLLDQLCQTDSASDLLDATAKLVHLQLDDAFVEFPQHYAPQDYYLLLMGRLLDMHQNHSLKIAEDSSKRTLVANFVDAEIDTNFTFELPKQSGMDGAFFESQKTHEPLFYLNPTERILRFSNHALINFFIVSELQHVSDVALDAVVKPLMDFAHYLADDLDFTVDYGILEPANETKFALANPQLDLTVIDKLFVATTDTSYKLLNLPQNNGAELVLERGIKLILSFAVNDQTHSWFFQVLDPKNQYSFFSVLLHFKLVREWYLANREALSVQSKPLLTSSKQRVVSSHIEHIIAESGNEPQNLSATVIYQPKEHEQHRRQFDDYDVMDEGSEKEGD